LTFLGMEVEKGRFEFIYNDADKSKFKIMAKKMAEVRQDKKERFRINYTLNEYLEIVPISKQKL